MSVGAMIFGFNGWMATSGAHARQSEQCNLVRTAARKAWTSPSRTTARGSNGQAMSVGARRRRERSTRASRDTRGAAPRPDMARAVAAARESIAWLSDPFATDLGT